MNSENKDSEPFDVTQDALDSTSLQNEDTVNRSLKRIGHYRILQPIGQGGMGQVFMAEQSEPVKRRVALKIIKTDTPSREIVARFEAERQALAMMDHQNIAKVLDAGITEEGRPYFAMELVKGVPITEYCDTNKLTPNERLELFVQACRAIQHAHMKGIIHRDIKPSNVLVTLYDGRPVAKVIDFGLAKALQETTQLTNRTLFTQYGQVVGTLAYMSPEQAEMNALDVDTRTDVYSLGVVLYELLTGSTPLTRERIRSEAFDRILALIRTEEVSRPSQRLSDSGERIAGISGQRKTEPKRLSVMLKGDLDWIAVKALEKDRTRRYDTPAALAEDVARYVSGEPINARPPTVGYRLRKTVQRNRSAFGVAVSVFAIVLLALAATSIQVVRARRAEASALQEKQNADNAAKSAQRAGRFAEKESQRRLEALQASTLNQISAVRLAARPGFRSEIEALLTEATTRTIDRDEQRFLRQEYFHTLVDPVGKGPIVWNASSQVSCLAVSPDSKNVFVGCADGKVSILNLDDGQLFDELTTGKGQLFFVAAPLPSTTSQGLQPVTCREDQKSQQWLFERWSRTGSDWQASQLLALPLAERVAVSDDLKYCAKIGEKTTVWDVIQGEEVSSVDTPKNMPIRGLPAVSRSGKWLAFGSPGRLYAVDLLSGEIWSAETGPQLTGVCGVAFSPDGNRIAWINESGIELFDFDTFENVGFVRGRYIYRRSVQPIAFKNSSQTLAFPNHQIKTMEQWDYGINQVDSVLPNDGNSYSSAVTYSSDDRTLVSAAGETVRIWKIRPQREVIETQHPRTGISDVLFDQRGSRLTAVGKDGVTRTIDSDSGDLETEFKGLPGNGQCTSMSPDGLIVVSGNTNGLVCAWNAKTSDELGRSDTNLGNVSTLQFHPTADLIAACGAKGVRIFEFAREENGEGSFLLPDPVIASTKISLFTCFSHNGDYLVWPERPGKRGPPVVKVFDVRAGNTLGTIPSGPGNAVESIGFLEDNQHIAFVNSKRELEVWNILTQRRRGDFPVVEQALEGGMTGHIGVGKDGVIAIAFADMITLMSVSDGEILLRIPVGNAVWSLAWSPDGHLLSAGTANGLKLWNVDAIRKAMKQYSLDWGALAEGRNTAP